MEFDLTDGYTGIINLPTANITISLADDSNQVISHGAIGCSPVAMCVLQWRYD